MSSLLTEPPRLLNAEDMKFDGMFVLESGYEAWNGTAARTNLEHKTYLVQIIVTASPSF